MITIFMLVNGIFFFLQADENHFDPACSYWDERWIFQTLRWFQGSRSLLMILHNCVALTNGLPSIRNCSFFLILFFVLSMWAKDGCKLDETSVSETVSKCTLFSTFALIMKVEEKVTRSIGHSRIPGIRLELACKWGQCRDSFQMRMTLISFRSPSPGASNYPIFLSRRFDRPIYF